MLDTYEQHSKTKLVATFIAILVVAGLVLVSDHLKTQHKTVIASSQTSDSPSSSDTSNTTPATTTGNTTATADTTPTTNDSSATIASSGYKDGSYSATSDYSVPHGEEEIQVTLTLQNGTISDVSIQNSENDFDSASYQEAFSSAYKSAVVGKKISDLQLSNVSGASDTTQGFNDALNQIASKAQS